MQFLMESVQPIYLHDEFDKLGYYADELPEEYRVKISKYSPVNYDSLLWYIQDKRGENGLYIKET